MKVLVVSDSSDKSSLGIKIKQDLREFLKGSGHIVSDFDILKEDLLYCVGCFGCWLKTPGQCVFDDTSRNINQAYIGSDIAVFVSPVKYGCYTPAIRRALDRAVPNVLPFFKTVNGELHHAPRYKKYPRFVTFGYGESITAEEEATFRSLSNANAINFQADKAETYIGRKETEVGDILKAFDKYIKECELR